MSLVSYRFQMKLLENPEKTTDLLWGEHPSGGGDGTFLRLRPDGSLRWNIVSAYDDFPGQVQIYTYPGSVPTGEWFTLEVTYDPETEEGDVTIDGMSAVEKVQGTGGLGGDMSEITRMGTGSGDLKIWRMWIQYPGREVLEYDFHELDESAPTEGTIYPVSGEVENGIVWSSGEWRISGEAPWLSSSKNFDLVVGRWRETSLNIYRYGYSQSAPSADNGELIPNEFNLPESDLVIRDFYYRDNSSSPSGYFRLLSESPVTWNNFKITLRRITPPEHVFSRLLPGNSFNLSAEDAQTLIGTAYKQTLNFTLTFAPATLSEQIEAKVKPAYEKDGIHYNIDDEPVTLDEKGFIIRDEDTGEIIRPEVV